MKALDRLNVEMLFNTSCNKRSEGTIKVAVGWFKTDNRKSFIMRSVVNHWNLLPGKIVWKDNISWFIKGLDVCRQYVCNMETNRMLSLNSISYRFSCRLNTGIDEQLVLFNGYFLFSYICVLL